MSTTIVLPIETERSPGNSRLILAGRGAGESPVEFADEIQLEVSRYLGSIKKNVRSESYQSSHSGIKQETGVHALYRMYAQAITGD